MLSSLDPDCMAKAYKLLWFHALSMHAHIYIQLKALGENLDRNHTALIKDTP